MCYLLCAFAWLPQSLLDDSCQWLDLRFISSCVSRSLAQLKAGQSQPDWWFFFLFYTPKPQQSPPESNAFAFRLTCWVCLIAWLETSPAGRHLCNAIAKPPCGCHPKQSLFLPKTCDRIGTEKNQELAEGKNKKKPSVDESAFSWVGDLWREHWGQTCSGNCSQLEFACTQRSSGPCSLRAHRPQPHTAFARLFFQENKVHQDLVRPCERNIAP